MNEPRMMQVSNDGVVWLDRVVVCELAGKAMALDDVGTVVYADDPIEALREYELSEWSMWKEITKPKTRTMTSGEALAWGHQTIQKVTEG